MKKKLVMRKNVWWLILLVFILMNIVAYFHAYKFTHFAESTIEKTKNAKALSIGEKLEALFFGVNNPRPTNKAQPKQPFETVILQSNHKIECWHIKLPISKGTVVIFSRL